MPPKLDMKLSSTDLQILRDIVKQQRELAESPRMQSLQKDWQAHGAFQAGGRPMVTIELGTFAGDILPGLLLCQGEEARALEWELRSRLVGRGTEDPETVSRRLETALKELPFANECDYVVVNDQVEEAAESLRGILRASRCRQTVMAERVRRLLEP